MNRAESLAAGQDAANHWELGCLLASEDYLYRLDSPKEYSAPPRLLRLARVLRALMDNPAPSAGQLLVWLTRQAGFLDRSQRRLLLIQALAAVRPAPADAASFWDRNSQADSPYLTVTIGALADNGTPNALRLLETKMADPEIESDLKISWMRRPILVHRNEAPVLDSCGRMLVGLMSQELRPPLVGALFDYQSDWYRSNPPVPPVSSAMDPQARKLSRGIAQYALQNIPLDSVLKAKVELSLRQP